jgi:hypothetical protein
MRLQTENKDNTFFISKKLLKKEEIETFETRIVADDLNIEFSSLNQNN